MYVQVESPIVFLVKKSDGVGGCVDVLCSGDQSKKIKHITEGTAFHVVQTTDKHPSCDCIALWSTEATVEI